MRSLFLALALAAAGCAGSPPAAAQAAPAPQNAVQDCLALAAGDATAQRTCIGRRTAWCIEHTAGGETTSGTVQCSESERLQWEEARAARIGALRAQETASQVALLDAALEQHARWARARCAYEASIYEGGSLARVIGAMCMRDAVAEHTLSLINRGAEL